MKGVLLVNIGSPNSPEKDDVKPYLDEFLMDEYVVDLPYLLRAFVVKGMILTVKNRARQSSEAYKKIWSDQGSPLIVISESLRDKLSSRLDVPVEIGMRYGNPAIKSGLEALYKKGVKDVLVLPLYPQYTLSTTKTVIEYSKLVQQNYFPDIKMSFLPAFYNKPEYIDALSDVIKRNLEDFDYDKLVFTYHGVPERHLRKTGLNGTHKNIKEGECCCQPNSSESEYCYRTHCFEITNQVINKLSIPRDKVVECFQSRMSGTKWIAPYTDEVLSNLPKKDVEKIAVACPSFTADCLETLEELSIRGKDDFINNGGKEYLSIPCLNDEDVWVDALSSWIKEWVN